MITIIYNIIIIVIISICVLFLKDLIYEDKAKRINKLLPGPKEYPIFGNLLQIYVNDVAKSFGDLYRLYGPIFRVRLGDVETVVITGNEMLEECFLKNKIVFHERFVRRSRKQNNGLDIIHTNGDYWSTLKNVVLLEMTSKKIKSYQPEIKHQIDQLTNKIYRDDTTIITNLNFCLKEMLLNVMLKLVFGAHEDINTKTQLIESITRFFVSSGMFIYSDYIPFLLPLDLINLTRGNLFKDFKVLTNYTQMMVNKYESTYISNNKNNNSNTEENHIKNKSMMECYYDKYKEGKIKYESVINSSTNLILAGTDSSSNTLSFMIAALINNPEIQDKMYDEIITNLNEEITTSDHIKCPYTVAVIKEANRLFSVAPLSEPHITSEDVEVMGYKIAKGTQIIQNLYSTHRSDEYWDNPLSFNPARWLNKNQKPTYHFGIGIRSCLGKGFADYVLFTTITSLIKKFRFINPNPSTPISEEGIFGLVMNCQDYSVILKKRI